MKIPLPAIKLKHWNKEQATAKFDAPFAKERAKSRHDARGQTWLPWRTLCQGAALPSGLDKRDLVDLFQRGNAVTHTLQS